MIQRGPGGEGYIITGYEGIKYAADHGCSIINCSRGGTAGGQLEQDVITYATINKNVSVCCSAGNDANNVHIILQATNMQYRLHQLLQAIQNLHSHVTVQI